MTGRDQFNARCLIGKIHDRHVSVLSLKLILAGNGALLSKCFVLLLAGIAKRHDVYFHIDEVFTAGRTPQSFLLTQSMPHEFIERVSTISIGKWTGVGLAVVHKNFHTPEYDHSGKRGISTPIPMYREALNRFDFLAGHGRHSIPTQ
jgi:hypothetical protein